MTANRSASTRSLLAITTVCVGLLAGCDREIEVELASVYAAVPAPEFLTRYTRATERGKLNEIRVYDVTSDKADLMWSAVAKHKPRARGVYRFTYGVAPLGMINKQAPRALEHKRTYEVCAIGRNLSCSRYSTSESGVLVEAERPASAYRLIPKNLR